MPARITSVDCFRVFAVVAVVAIHSHYCHFTDDYAAWERWAAIALNQAARFAVPFFFIISGVFVGRDLRRGAEPAVLAASIVRRLVALFLAWSALFVAIDLAKEWAMRPTSFSLQEALPTLSQKIFTGARIHLWFLPALVIGTVVVLLTYRLRTRWRILLYAALYSVGLAGATYATITGFDLGANARNGPLFSTMFVGLGAMMGLSNFQPSRKQALVLLGAGALLHAAEVIVLTQVFDVSPFGIDFVAGTIPLGLGVVFLALSMPRFGEGSAISRLGPLVLGIYLIHLDVSMAIGRINPIRGFAGQLILILGSFVVCLAIIWSLRGLPPAQWLFALKSPGGQSRKREIPARGLVISQPSLSA